MKRDYLLGDLIMPYRIGKKLNIGIIWVKMLAVFAFLLGLFSTMPIVGVVVMGRDISFFKILFAAAVCYFGLRLLRTKKLSFGKNISLLNIWLVIGLVGCVCGALFLRGGRAEFGLAARSYIPKVLLLLIFSLVWSSDREADGLAETVICGFLWGCALNCLWATVDAVGYYVTGKSLHNLVFMGYSTRNGIDYNTMSLIYNGMIRSGGFNSDPAQLGFVAPVLFGYGLSRKHIFPAFLGLCGIAASASTTGLVTAAVLCLLLIRKRESKPFFECFTRLQRIELYAFLAGTAFVLLWQGDRLISLAGNMLSRFFSRIRSEYLEYPGPDIRIRYVLQAFGAMRAVLPFMLFGSGFGTASLGYVITPEVIAVIGSGHDFAYDMENTYLAYFFDTGIVGLAVFLMMMAVLLIRYRKRYASRESVFSDCVYLTVCAILLSMLFYHYILFAPQMLVITIALSRLDAAGIAAFDSNPAAKSRSCAINKLGDDL